MGRLRLRYVEHRLCGESSDDGSDDGPLECVCSLCCFCFLLPVELYYRAQNAISMHHQKKLLRQRREATIIHPLPTEPRHKLSVPSMSTPIIQSQPHPLSNILRYPRESKQEYLPMSDQQTCPLFCKFSGEIRDMIYLAVIGNYTIHVVKLGGVGRARFAHMKKHRDVPLWKSTSMKWIEFYPYRDSDVRSPDLGRIPPGEELVPLLKTCKRM